MYQIRSAFGVASLAHDLVVGRLAGRAPAVLLVAAQAEPADLQAAQRLLQATP